MFEVDEILRIEIKEYCLMVTEHSDIEINFLAFEHLNSKFNNEKNRINLLLGLNDAITQLNLLSIWNKESSGLVKVYERRIEYLKAFQMFFEMTDRQKTLIRSILIKK